MPGHRRAADWRRAIGETYFPLDLAFRDAPRFEGALALWRIGEVTLTRLTSEALRYRRSRRHLAAAAREEEYLVTIPVTSPVSFSQCGKDVRCPPGGFILERSHEPYDFAHEAHCDLWALKIGAGLLAGRLRAPDRFCSLGFDATEGAGGLLADLLPLLPKRLATLGPESRAAVGRQLVDLVVLAVAEDPRTLTSGASAVRAAHLARIETIVRARLAEPGLDAATVARAAGVSTRYLHDLMRDAGQPLAAWIRALRLAAARAALADPARRETLAELAYAVGFADQSAFSRAFRAAYGLAPRDWRARARAGAAAARIARQQRLALLPQMQEDRPALEDRDVAVDEPGGLAERLARQMLRPPLAEGRALDPVGQARLLERPADPEVPHIAARALRDPVVGDDDKLAHLALPASGRPSP
jgi:AraC-like DNA-binding protein